MPPRAASTANDTTINTANAQGVALAAAIGLYQKLRADETAMAADRAQIAALEQLVAEQRAAIASLKQTVGALSRRSATNHPRLASRQPGSWRPDFVFAFQMMKSSGRGCLRASPSIPASGPTRFRPVELAAETRGRSR